MKKSFFTILQYGFFLGLGILFVWLTLKDITEQQWQSIQLSLKGARHWIIVPVIVMLLLSHYIRSLRWKLLMEPLGYKPTTFNTWAAVMIGYLVNAAVPRLGEVIKCTILAKYEKVRADKLVGTIVVERIIDLFCLLLVFILALVFQGHIIGDFTVKLFGDFFKDNTGNFSGTKTLITIGSLILFFVLIYFLLKRFGHIDIVVKIKSILKGIGNGLNSVRLIQHKGLFLFQSILIWVLYLASTTIGLYALKESESLGIAAGLTTLAIGSVGMLVTPGGIGAYPLFVANLMGLYGLDVPTTGTTLGWLLWSAQTLITLGAGLFFSALLSYHNKQKKSETRNQFTSQST